MVSVLTPNSIQISRVVAPTENATSGARFDWFSDIGHVPARVVNPLREIYQTPLAEIAQEIHQRGSISTALIGGGHFGYSQFGPGLHSLLHHDPELARKIGIVVVDLPRPDSIGAEEILSRIQASLSGLPVTLRYADIQSIASEGGQLNGVYNATPPIHHLPTSTLWLDRTRASGAALFHEKPVCLPGQEPAMRRLVEENYRRMQLVDSYLGSSPFQFLTGTLEGAELLRKIGKPALINGFLQESMLVHPDRNGEKGEFGLLRRKTQPYDFSVGISTDCAPHPLVGNYVLHTLLHGYKERQLINPASRTDIQARYARSHIEDPQLDDTYGAFSYMLEGTRHNIVWGKELPESFFGFDIVGQNGNRLICCLGFNSVPEYPNGIAPYLMYIPNSKEKADAECITFKNSDETGAAWYAGILLGFLSMSVGRSDLLVPTSRSQVNEAGIAAIEFLAEQKKIHYDTRQYDSYSPSTQPQFGIPYGNNMGLGSEFFNPKGSG